ncbi:MAG: hypothetical protein O4808_06530 [Trichodesmium sp. St17_bin3_1_1]|nr:hypothetical protein [Trichodesmium sp. St17_bin3_1_1]
MGTNISGVKRCNAVKAFYSLHIKDLGDRFVLTAVELWNLYLIAV